MELVLLVLGIVLSGTGSLVAYIGFTSPFAYMAPARYMGLIAMLLGGSLVGWVMLSHP